MAPEGPGTGGGAAASQDPGACLYIPYQPAARFPGRSDVDRAGEAFVAVAPDAGIAELTVSPGLIRIRVPDPDPHFEGDGSISDSRRPRGQIKAWSAKSRTSMTRRFATLDYTPWSLRLAVGWLVVMLTLTYPSAWVELVPSADQALAHLKAMRSRIERATGRTALAIWKREFQRRGAPHFHLLLPLPTTINGESVQEWVSRAWFEIVDSADPKHLVAGTGIDWAEGLRSVDPVRVARYFSGHAAPSGRSRKEYQNVAPDVWLDNGSVGRFWGFWGLVPAESTVELSKADLVEVRRVLRRLDRSRRRTKVVTVRRVRRSTGEFYVRRVRRRSVLGHLAAAEPTGASLFANDAPSVALALSRLISPSSVPGRLDPKRLP